MVEIVSLVFCYAVKGGGPQVRREDDDANVIFQVAGVPSVQEWPQHTTYTEPWEISMCSQSLLLKVKVLIVFLGTATYRFLQNHWRDANAHSRGPHHTPKFAGSDGSSRCIRYPYSSTYVVVLKRQR